MEKSILSQYTKNPHRRFCNECCEMLWPCVGDDRLFAHGTCEHYFRYSSEDTSPSADYYNPFRPCMSTDAAFSYEYCAFWVHRSKTYGIV